MNRRIRVAVEVFIEVLVGLGYLEKDAAHLVVTAYGKEQHWRRHNFHLIIRPGGKGHMALTLHRDAYVPYPPGHKAVFGGEAVREEFNRILASYHARMNRPLPQTDRAVDSGGIM